MTQEQIELQAIAYAEFISHNEDGDNYDPYFDGMNAGAKSGFKAGAKWRIDSVWHKPEEKPKDKPVLAVSENRLPVIVGPNCSEWEDIVNEFKLTEWAYIDDFIQQEE